MEFGVLGGLSVEDSDGRHLPTAPKQRQLLGLLLLHAGEVMPAHTCVSEIWGEHPPPSAATTLQTYVMHLRRLLARMPSVGSREAARDRLRTTGQGYLMVVEPEELDLLRFERLVEQAGRAGDDATVERLLRGALALWSRPVLADVRTGPVLRSAVTHWERRRLEVHEMYLDVRLRLGRPRDVLAELAVLTRSHPTHEALHARYMTALHQTGRAGDALDVASRLTSRLARDLGVVPGPVIGRLQAAIRRGGSVVVPFPLVPPSVPGRRRP
ncbi:MULTISPECIES: AfsR/SARP family transcriptional regulator [Streptomyces]|jgi:DNA-binding SARP family transcriptional activator|uniref:AknI n=2 Tax=Streptomyces bottropensis TaxID=42235 RepID=M3FMJ9_9ACTN|nr:MULTISPECIES: AfsR/SARP family transcriptional regulator [Streptomyces]AHL46719.1 SARP regulatory protein [Streptomyces bottropensis]EMF53314.1 AknI [Streptomyces bottropensis ATCC 25435]MZD17349.1 transcriptional regulator [Streptomyces sp. SID5476]